MGTETTRLKLYKPDHRERAYHTPVNGGFDAADARFFKEGAGTPNGNVVPDYLGQRYYQTDAVQGLQWWTSREAGNNQSWVNEGQLENFGNKAARDALLPVEGEMFIRTDIAPGAIERWNGSNWIRLLGPRQNEIQMWTGSLDLTGGYLTAMPGWTVCAGQGTLNGVVIPDLVDRFVRGTQDAGDLQTSGGADSHLVTLDEMPPHRHMQFNSNQRSSTGGSNNTRRSPIYRNDWPNSDFAYAMEDNNQDLPNSDANCLPGSKPHSADDVPPVPQGAQTAVPTIPAYTYLAYIIFCDV